jgi:hypothetical protein
MKKLKTVNKIFNDYYDLCAEVGLENKYIHPKNIAHQFQNKLTTKDTIYVDTREQSWLKFNIPFVMLTGEWNTLWQEGFCFK